MGVAGMKEHTPRGCSGVHLRGVCFGGREMVGAYDEHGAAHEGPAVYNAGGHTKKPSTVPVCVEKFTPILYKGRGSAAYSLA